MTPVDGIERPSMIHDMAITRRYVVLVVAPLFFDGHAAMAGGSLLYWQPEHGTRIALVPRTAARCAGATTTRSGCGTPPTPTTSTTRSRATPSSSTTPSGHAPAGGPGRTSPGP